MFKKYSRAFFLKHLRWLIRLDSQFMVSGEGKSEIISGFRLRLWEFSPDAGRIYSLYVVQKMANIRTNARRISDNSVLK